MYAGVRVTTEHPKDESVYKNFTAAVYNVCKV